MKKIVCGSEYKFCFLCLFLMTCLPTACGASPPPQLGARISEESASVSTSVPIGTATVPSLAHGVDIYDGPTPPNGFPASEAIRESLRTKGPESTLKWLGEWARPSDIMALAACHWAITKALWDNGDPGAGYRWLVRSRPQLESLATGNSSEQRAWAFFGGGSDTRLRSGRPAGLNGLRSAVIDAKKTELAASIARDPRVSTAIRTYVGQILGRIEHGDWVGVWWYRGQGTNVAPLSDTDNWRWTRRGPAVVSTSPSFYSFQWDPDSPTLAPRYLAGGVEILVEIPGRVHHPREFPIEQDVILYLQGSWDATKGSMRRWGPPSFMESSEWSRAGVKLRGISSVPVEISW